MHPPGDALSCWAAKATRVEKVFVSAKLYLHLKNSPISQTLIQIHKNNNNELQSDLKKLLNVVVDFYYKQIIFQIS